MQKQTTQVGTEGYPGSDQKNYLIDWIHRVETQLGKDDGDKRIKRLQGLVTEAYFQRALTKREWLGVPDEFSTGWSYRTELTESCRSWFKLSDGMVHGLNSDFVTSLLTFRPADQFYTVRALMGSSSYEGLPTVRWEVQNVDGASGAKSRLNQDQANIFAAQIQRNVGGAIGARGGLSHAGGR
jgi:hypothetical protein